MTATYLLKQTCCYNIDKQNNLCKVIAIIFRKMKILELFISYAAIYFSNGNEESFRTTNTHILFLVCS